ncbi:HAD family phosphatase [uncultured Sulfitobacter sp.]|uniref:HAD family hydrolase n=1 Tax=uncultured Sulfitobacter sp. TaxID=191468 RepID=UPI0026315B28|nr:HAD family phosphatase [uncultured Sulfitobacter sp.]
MTRPAQGVLFDMDGLLLDTERLFFECFTLTRAHFALPETPEVYLRSIGLRQDQSDEVIRESLPREIGLDQFNAQWDKRIAVRFAEDIPLKHGALPLLQMLAASGYKMAVATSTKTATARAHLAKAGLLPHIRDVIGGDLVKRGKPDPETYHKAAALIGLTASQCIAFEDSETGTRAALASSALTVQIPDLVPPSKTLIAQGHLIAPNLIEGAVKAGLIRPQALP